MSHNYLYHMTEYGLLNSILKDGLMLDKGREASQICLAASVNGCLGLAPMCSGYWAARAYYDSKKTSFVGQWYFWQTKLYKYPVLQVDISGLENHLTCIPNKDSRAFYLYGKHKQIPEYRCNCDISAARLRIYTNCSLELDVMVSDKMRTAPAADWKTDRVIVQCDERMPGNDIKTYS